MRFLNDPNRRARRLRAILALSWLAPALAAAWAFWPLEVSNVSPPSLSPEHHSDRAPVELALPQAPMDPSAFNVVLWNPPPAPALPLMRVESPPPPPPAFQLLGIVREQGRLKAALYDIERDCLVIVAEGERIREQLVSAIDESSVQLSDGGSTRRLALTGSAAP